MKLPDKTYILRDCKLGESDFECNRQAKPIRIVQLLQDITTEHAEELGVGWNTMDKNGMLWVLSKIKIVFECPVTRKNSRFTLYTWPLAPNRFYAERCFAVVDDEQLFSATTLWSIISKNERRILPAEIMNKFYHGEYCNIHCDTAANFQRVRLDDKFRFAYTTTVFRSDLDHNGHVNNTIYVNYALNVLAPQDKIRALEIVYHKELKLGEVLEVLYKREMDCVSVVGQRDNEVCFTATLTLY